MSIASTIPVADSEASEQRVRGQRTCVGCGKQDDARAMVRLVVSQGGEVAVDLAGGNFGRGAHVHAETRCVAQAPRGLARSFKGAASVTADGLASAIVTASERRVAGLLASAVRSQHVVIGGDMAGRAYQDGKVGLLVVARDAQSAASLGPVLHAIANGSAVAWGTKEELGKLVHRSEVAVLGIASQPLAAAVRTAVMMANNVAARGGATHEEHLRGAKATED